GKLGGSGVERRWQRPYECALHERSQPAACVYQATMAWKRSGGSRPLSSTAKVLVKKYLILRCACLSYTTGGHIALRGRAVRLIGLLQSPFIWASGDLPTPPAGSPSVSPAQSPEPLISSLSHHPRSWPAAPVRRD